jgi:hypothetical protein
MLLSALALDKLAGFNLTRGNNGSRLMNNRQAKRSSSGYMPARVSFAPGEARYFCVVHNRSDRGLCIEIGRAKRCELARITLSRGS